jgi:hypothetical protein
MSSSRSAMPRTCCSWPPTPTNDSIGAVKFPTSIWKASRMPMVMTPSIT